MANENNILIQLLDSANSWRQLKPELSKLNTTKSSTSRKKTIAGKVFEYFCKYYFIVDPTQDEYETVWMYEEIPENIRTDLQLPPIDHGIDILLKNRDGEYSAVQCKFKNDESKSLSWSGDKIANVFALGTNCKYVVVISNCSDVTKVAQGFKEKYTQFLYDRLSDISAETFDRIRQAAKGEEPKRPTKYDPLNHQEIAIKSVVDHFATNNRGQLILPCGAGKTLTSLWIKERLNASHTLVLVPSLALLKQIKSDWAHQKRNNYRYICVCSEKDIDKDSYDVPVSHVYEVGGTVTTNPCVVSNFLAKDADSVIFSTYQSIDVISIALQTNPDFSFGLVICDEAHRTSGSTKKNTFTLVHNNEVIRAKKRLYMTATPRVVSTSLKNKMEDYSLIADMSNPQIFGEEAYRMSFGKAIDEDILVDYKIVGIGVSDQQVKKYIEEREFTGEVTAEDLAHNFALNLVMEKHKAFHALTFHSRVKLASDFAERHSKFFQSILSKSVSGKQSTTYRKRVLDEFKISPIGVVSNARCLTEGVDVPTIDLIYFCDPKSSKIDIVQASGRALRKDKSGRKELGFIVVPIFHHISEDIEKEIKQKPIFKYLIQVVRSLCDQDERLEAEINQIAFNKGLKSSSRISIDYEDDSENIIRLEGLEDRLKNSLFDEIIKKTRSFWEQMYLELQEFKEKYGHINVSKRNSPQLGNWIYEQRRQNRAQRIDPIKKKKLDELGFDWGNEKFREEGDYDEVWWKNYEKLLKYLEENGDTAVPARYKDKALGTWVVGQRAKKRKDELSQDRIDLLDEIDFIWEPRGQRETIFLSKLKKFVRENDHAHVPTNYGEDRRFGRMVNVFRTTYLHGTKMEDGSIYHERNALTLTPTFIRKVEDLGFKWSIKGNEWDANYSEAVEYLKTHGHLNIRQPENGRLYRWLYLARKHPEKLSTDRRSKLESLGVDLQLKWEVSQETNEATPQSSLPKKETKVPSVNKRPDKEDQPTKPKKKNSNRTKNFSTDTWNKYYMEMLEYKIENGHTIVSRYEGDQKRLGHWAYVQQLENRRGNLSSLQLAKLNQLGFDFGKTEENDSFTSHFEELKKFFDENGHSDYPKHDSNPTLYHWTLRMRGEKRKNTLSTDHIEKLNSINFSWNPRKDGRIRRKRDDEWFEMLLELKAFKETHRHANVSQLDPEHKKLGRWLNDQRLYKKGRKQKGTKQLIYLTDERRELLEEVGIIWDMKEHEWKTKLKLLSEYHQKNGDFNVKQADKEYGALYYFLRNARIKGLPRRKLNELANIGLDISELKVNEE